MLVMLFAHHAQIGRFIVKEKGKPLFDPDEEDDKEFLRSAEEDPREED